MSGFQRYLFGEWVDGSSPLTAEEAALICEKAQSRVELLREYPLDKILDLFEKVGAAWANKDFAPRVELLEKLPGITGFSREMLTLAMDEIVWMLDSEKLRKKIQTEMRGLHMGSESLYVPETNTQLRWSPLGVVMHVLSGNVFLVGLGSLIEGMITGNVTLLKMSSAETLFLPKFLKSLQELDEDGVVSRCVALVDYPSASVSVMETFKAGVDGVLVWGGEDAVRAYRDGLSAGKKFIVYGPKLSLAVVTDEGIVDYGAEEVAKKLAAEISVWDQNACTAPQLCYVQGEANARELAEHLHQALANQAEELPAGPTDANVAVEIQKMRGVAEVAEVRGEGLVRYSRGNCNWTVVVDKSKVIEPSPLHRTIRLVPFEKAEEIIEEAATIRGYLQTVGLIAGPQERMDWFHELSDVGALKVAELGQMGSGEIDDPHDGSYDLAQFGHFVVGRLPTTNPGVHPSDMLSKKDHLNLVNSRLRTLIHHARKSSYYGDVLKGLKIDTVEDLPKMPILERHLMEAHMPPQGRGLATGKDDGGGYVSRSGGSTGVPKFSLYDSHDWNQMIGHAQRVLRSAGLRKGDRVANFMLAGDLYGSFVSFDHINYRIGAQSFAFAGTVDPEIFLKLWHDFDINVVQAIPARFMQLLRKVKDIEPNFTMQKAIYAGTPLSKSDYKWLREICQLERISSIIGANDGGQIAFQCAHLSGAYHHVVDDFNYIELVNDRGEPVPDGEAGRILITSLLKFAYPLIRYDLGDSGRFVNEKCVCGRNNRIIEYLGRRDDTVCVGLMNVQFRDMVAALDGFPVSGLQLVIRNSIEGEELLFNVETEKHQNPSLADEMRQALITRVDKIKQGVDEGTLSKLVFTLHPLGSLTRNQRSGKLKTLIDERT